MAPSYTTDSLEASASQFLIVQRIAWVLFREVFARALATEITQAATTFLHQDRAFRRVFPWETAVLDRMDLDEKALRAAP